MLLAFRRHPRFALVSRNLQFPTKSVFCSNVAAAGNTMSPDIIADSSSKSIVPRSTISNEVSKSVGSNQNLVKTNLQLETEIDYIFKAQHISRALLSNFVMNSLINLDSHRLAHLMRVTGKLTKGRRDMLLRYYMPAISARLKMLSTKSWNFKSISCIIFGLQRMNESDDGILDILETMTEISDETAKGTQLPLPQNIYMMMLGLEKNHCTEKETKNFLKLIVKMMKSCKSDFEAHHISGCLFGLQSTTSDGSDVLEILSTLTEKINECTNDFIPQNVSGALYGLQGMRGDEPVVLALLVALETKIHTCQREFTPKDVAYSLHGLQRMSSDHIEVRNILRALEPRIKSCTEPLDSMYVSEAMVGLERMSSDCPEVLAIIRALTPSLRKFELKESKEENNRSKQSKENKESKDIKESKESKEMMKVSKESEESDKITKATDVLEDEEEDEVEYVRPLDAQGVSNVLRGFRRKSSNSPEVCAMLKALGPRLLGSTQTMNVHQLKSAFSGIRGLNSSRAEVRPVILTLIQKVKQCNQVFSPECVATTLGSLSGMSSEKYEVRDLAAVLPRNVDLCWRPLNAYLVGDVMYGLQGMNSDHAEVEHLIKSVIRLVKECKGNFDGEAVSRVLCGLRGMSPRSAQVPPLVAALTSKMSHFSEFRSAKELSDAIFGLQGMTTDCPEISALLELLTPKIVQFDGPFSSDEIVRSLYGLQGVRSGEESIVLTNWLYSKVKDLRESSSSFEDISTESLVQLCQMLSIIIPTFKIPEIDSLNWVEINNSILEEIELRKKRSDSFFMDEKFLSVAAKRVIGVVEELFLDSEVEIMKEHELCGLFESEILLRLSCEKGDSSSSSGGSSSGSGGSSGGKKDILLNIEINWSMDRLDKHKKYCTLRDAYLRSKGIIVERLNLSSIKRIKDGYLGEMVNGFVQDARVRSRSVGDVDNV